MGPANMSSSLLVDSLLPRLPLSYPVYHTDRPSVCPGISDPIMSVLAPFLAYWLVSLLFTLIDSLSLPLFEKHRIHEPAEVRTRNRVTPREVVKAVLLQQAIQTALGLLYLDEGPGEGHVVDHRADMRPYARAVVGLATTVLGSRHARWVLARYGSGATQWLYWWGMPILQFFWASFLMDTWQYFWHRFFHNNKFLYRHVHSVHHRLYVPYAYGALYNHPLEGFVLDTLGALASHLGSAMTTRQAIVLFAVSTAKTVDDHCGLALPWDPFQALFGNNADYHDIHHQQFGIKRNFSQPYFTHWDVLLGTRMTRAQASSRRGGKTVPMQPHTDGRDPLVQKLAARESRGGAEEEEEEGSSSSSGSGSEGAGVGFKEE